MSNFVPWLNHLNSSAPFWIRAAAARVYHIGGLHSGCGVSGTIWFIFFVGQATREFAEHKGVSTFEESSSECTSYIGHLDHLSSNAGGIILHHGPPSWHPRFRLPCPALEAPQ